MNREKSFDEWLDELWYVTKEDEDSSTESNNKNDLKEE